MKLCKGDDIAILSTRTITHNLATAIENLHQNIGHYHFGFIKPLDTALLQNILEQYQTIITV